MRGVGFFSKIILACIFSIRIVCAASDDERTAIEILNQQINNEAFANLLKGKEDEKRLLRKSFRMMAIRQLNATKSAEDVLNMLNQMNEPLPSAPHREIHLILPPGAQNAFNIANSDGFCFGFTNTYLDLLTLVTFDPSQKRESNERINQKLLDLALESKPRIIPGYHNLEEFIYEFSQTFLKDENNPLRKQVKRYHHSRNNNIKYKKWLNPNREGSDEQEILDMMSAIKTDFIDVGSPLLITLQGANTRYFHSVFIAGYEWDQDLKEVTSLLTIDPNLQESYQRIDVQKTEDHKARLMYENNPLAWFGYDGVTPAYNRKFTPRTIEATSNEVRVVNFN